MNNNEILNEYARYKYVVENIKDVIWEVDTNAVFTFVSPAIKGMVGYNAEQMIGRCILDFLTDDSKIYLSGQLTNAPITLTNVDINHSRLYDVEFICNDGRTIWCEVSVKPIFRKKKLICYIGTTRDISDKKAYEKKLREMLAEQKRINERLENVLTFDMLTGAYNRRKYEFYISLEIEKSEKSQKPPSIIIFDIDNFKQVNDINGHNKGDYVLKDISALVKRSLRDKDKLFRWGGDEFIVILPETNFDSAFKTAVKIRETVDSYEFDIECKNVSVSLGVGTLIPNETSDQFTTRIDKALLRAKSSGKNNVEPG